MPLTARANAGPARKGQSSRSVVFHAARHHDAAVVASTQIPNKGAETGAFTRLLDQLDDDQLQGALITAEALHTVAAHAAYLRNAEPTIWSTSRATAPHCTSSWPLCPGMSPPRPR